MEQVEVPRAAIGTQITYMMNKYIYG